ncbi:MAG TPA: gliding motility protein GldN [Bacteroidia bacterium]|nr:gliding motility protein GldN [Bacteroidia bacterium]
MKNIIKIVALTALLFVGTDLFAQGVLTPQSQMQDQLYLKENAPNRRVIPWTFLREADVIWSKRIWRMIDLREKMNLDMYYPVTPNANRKSLWDIIVSSVKNKENKLTLYNVSPFDYDKSFTMPMSKTEGDSALLKIVTVIDSNGNSSQQGQALESPDLTQYMLKEDWFFDKQRSVMDVRILGMCPFKKAFDQNGNEIPGSSTIMFWIYFPQIRPVFSNAEVFNVHNDAERRTYEDIFWKRQFSSYILQESNVANRRIADYMKDHLDALLEAEKIKGDMFNLEHDMWQY